MNKDTQSPSERNSPDHLETDFSGPMDDDRKSLASESVLIRSLQETDLADIERIDKRITGSPRHNYLQQKVSEVINQSGIRISLVAEKDGFIVGYIMARIDYGEFGRTSSMAVIDTIGVDPRYAGENIGHSLMAQLEANLGYLRVDGIRTIVKWNDFDVLHFLEHSGFTPAQRLTLRCPI